MSRNYLIKNICDCEVEQQLQVLEIRNQYSVRKAMYTEHVIGTNEHLGYLSRLSEDKKQKVFVVLKEGAKPVGVVSVNAIDRLHRKSDWAFYLDENERGGLGATLEVAMLDYVFDKLELEKLNCEVIETNSQVVRMHKRLGFEEEGFRKANILKDGNRIGVHFLGITKGEWQAKRKEVCEGIKEKISDIKISFADEKENEEASPLTLIQQART